MSTTTTHSTGGPSISPTAPITLTTTPSVPITTITTTASTTTTHVPPTTTTTSSEVPTTTTHTTSTRTRTSTSSDSTTTYYTTSTYYTTTTEPTVPPTLPPSKDNSGALSAGAMVGIVVAAVVALIALVSAACMVARRQRRKRARASNTVFSEPDMQENYRPGGIPGGGGGGGGGGGSGAGVVSSGGRDRPISQDTMLASGFSNINSATGGGGRYGYEPEVGAAAAAVGGYAYDRQQQLQHRHGPPYPSSHQVGYTSPDESEYAQGDMYNPNYAERVQNDLAYRQYEQEQLYRQQMQMQQDQERLAATAAITGYYPMARSKYSRPTSNVYPELDQNPRYSEIEQERHLQQFMRGDSVTTETHSNHTSPMAPTPSSVDNLVQGQYPQSTPQDYVDPESDVRNSNSEPWPAPLTSVIPPTPVVVKRVSLPPIAASSVSPLAPGRPISMEVPVSSSSLSPGSGKRPHAPQTFPEYKRGPQVLIPETIQSTEKKEVHQQEMQHQSQNPQALSSQETYVPPPSAPDQWEK
ncbi:hypothetical protein MVEG_03143 [Podila verticillata NRRL 6337]|nr:hypothetical protein MVEG_03143 [Podila verticillata NRRL 6337]